MANLIKTRLISTPWTWLVMSLMSLGLGLAGGVLPVPTYAQEPPNHPFEITLAGSTRLPIDRPEAEQPQALNLLDDLPIRFIPNQGQLEAPEVQFHAKTLGGNLFFTPEAVVFALPAPDITQPYPPYEAVPQQTLVRLTFEGANPSPTIEGVQPLPGQVNFFLGNDPDRWQSNLTVYEAVVYRSLYPGIDLVYQGHEGRLKSEFIVAPGADPDLIRLRYNHINRVELAADGSLILHTPTGQLVEAPLLIYQEIDGVRHEVEGHYIIPQEGESQPIDPVIAINLSAYNPAYPLVIDPELIYSSYLGGNNFDFINTLVVDNSGNIWLAGQTNSTDFPLRNASKGSLTGDIDAFLTQLISTTGSYTYGYSSYLGGSNSDAIDSLAIDDAGHIYLTGRTTSLDFPTTPDAIQTSFGGGSDVFVTKLISNVGIYTYSYSSYLGGSDLEYSSAIAIDNADQIYIMGATSSTNFPTTPNRPQSNPGGGFTDIFVTHLISATGVYTYGFSTYLGGSNNDNGSKLVVNDTGEAYIVGATSSTDFPVTSNAIQPSKKAFSDGFVTRIISTATVLTYSFSSYLGGNNPDGIRDIALDNNGAVYITGLTFSSDFPTTPDAIQGSYGSGYNNGFVTQIISTVGVYTYGYSSYLGGSITHTAIALDSANNIYVVGDTTLTDFPVISDAIQDGFGGGYTDAFMIQMIDTAGVYTYGHSSYLGGSSDDYGGDIVVDDTGRIYIAGYTSSTDFPLTSNALQGNYGGAFSDSFITVIDLAQVNLELHKQVDDLTPTPDQRLTYTLVLKNKDTTPATNVTLSDFLPTGLSFAGPVTLEGSSGTVAQDEADLPILASGLTLASGVVVTVTFPVTVNVANTILTNTATVTGAEISAPQSASITITVGLETQPPSIPTLITPTGGITLTIPRPSFDWTDATDDVGVISYTLILTREGSSSTFTNTVSNFTPAADLVTGSYTWTVVAHDADGNTSASAVPATFTLVDLQAPEPPLLITPTGGITLSLARPSFDWTDATDDTRVISYTLILTPVGSSSTLFTSTASNFIPASDLANNNYTWTVTAHDAAGNVSPPATLALFTIMVDSQPPTVPTLITPTGGIALTISRPNFDWTDATDNVGVISYTLILTGAESGSTHLTSTLSSLMPTTDLANDKYTWTVTAYDAAGNVSPAAKTAIFTIAVYPPIHLPLILKQQ